MLKTLAGWLVTTLVAVLLVIASIVGAAAGPALQVAAGVLGVLLGLVVVVIAIRWLRRRFRRRPPLYIGVVSGGGRPPVLPRPDLSAEVSLSDLPEAQQEEFRRLMSERTAKADPARPRARTSMSAVLDSQEQEQEREAIQRDARQVRNTYRAMARFNSIENTTGEVKRSMQVRIDQLNERLAIYRAKWDEPAVDVAAYAPEVPDAGPAWLRAMVREADLVVWQLDHESDATG